MATIVPLTNEPSIVEEVVFEDRDITIQTKFNVRANHWTIDLIENGITLCAGLPLVLGADLIRNFVDLGLGALIMYDTTESGTEANQDNLGTDVILIHFTEEEKEFVEEFIATGGANISDEGAFSDGFDDLAFL